MLRSVSRQIDQNDFGIALILTARVANVLLSKLKFPNLGCRQTGAQRTKHSGHSPIILIAPRFCSFCTGYSQVAFDGVSFNFPLALFREFSGAVLVSGEKVRGVASEHLGKLRNKGGHRLAGRHLNKRKPSRLFSTTKPQDSLHHLCGTPAAFRVRVRTAPSRQLVAKTLRPIPNRVPPFDCRTPRQPRRTQGLTPFADSLLADSKPNRLAWLLR